MTLKREGSVFPAIRVPDRPVPKGRWCIGDSVSGSVIRGEGSERLVSNDKVQLAKAALL